MAAKSTPKSDQARAQREAATKAATKATPAKVKTEKAPPSIEWAELPAKANGGGSNRQSVWADRLNLVAEQSEAHPGLAAKVFTTKQAKGATVMASDLRRKLRDGKLNGLTPDVTFEIVTRGADIYARVVPADAAEGDAPEADADAETPEAAPVA